MGFFPLGDDNSQRQHLPWVTWTIIGLNVAVWLLELALGQPSFQEPAMPVVPEKITSGHDIVGLKTIDLGNGQSANITEYPGPVPIQLTLLTSMFMHGSWMHIIGNMWYMIIFADNIEDRLGHGRFILFYLLCGLAADASQILFDPHSLIPCLGASGAIAGCLGAYLVTLPTNPVRVIVVRTVMSLPAWIVLGAWIALQVVSIANSSSAAAQTGVAYMAHIGGFLTGIILVFVLSIGRGSSTDPGPGGGDGYNRSERYRA